MSKYGVHTLVRPDFAKHWKARMRALAVEEGVKIDANFDTDYDVSEGPLIAVLRPMARANPRYPPKWALRALYEAFGEYLKAGCRGDLEKALLGPSWTSAGNYACRQFKYLNKWQQALVSEMPALRHKSSKDPLAGRAERRKQARKFLKIKVPDGET